MRYQPKVSLITIVYNGERYLQQTIDSVANQTYGNIEYIIVDGGSKDGTLRIIQDNEEQITKWVSERDGGISDAFNKGIGMCSGEVIGLVNADDWLESNAVQIAVDNFDNADIVYGDIQFWYRGQRANRVSSDHSKLRRGMSVAHPSCFVKHRIYKELGVFDLKYKVAMDYELLLRFYRANVVFKKVPVIFSNMRKEGNSDIYWLRGLKEEKQIKDLYYSKLSNWYHFFRQYSNLTIKDVLRLVNFHT